MATVPSNYQAGPDTNPMRLYSATPTAGAATGGSASVGGGGAVSGAGATGAVNTATDKLSGKYRQYLRSQRMHPYAAAASLNLAAAAAAAGQTSFVPFSSAATAVAATPTFQHLPQISCYNHQQQQQQPGQRQHQQQQQQQQQQLATHETGAYQVRVDEIAASRNNQ
ncbi:GM10664 [Drosophila sechellia]|uniref:GM10664 n=1 Tax=Drosophila sechellia TaxID=7238 RepID=B4I3V5_DROSE|nr:GM10664 [Drosophila sechellia]